MLKNALDNKKKVLWIAHRQFLLEQAADAFQSYAYAEQMPHISSFAYRIISGSTLHDRMIDIKRTDNIIIASKDSVGRNLKKLDTWLKDESELYFVIDEAHHATAKTYRKIIDHLSTVVQDLKIIGLTATPFRTADSEKGLLKRIFPDDIVYSVSKYDL
jgi:superfamily II DNA or RNA helicase